MNQLMHFVLLCVASALLPAQVHCHGDASIMGLRQPAMLLESTHLSDTQISNRCSLS